MLSRRRLAESAGATGPGIFLTWIFLAEPAGRKLPSVALEQETAIADKEDAMFSNIGSQEAWSSPSHVSTPANGRRRAGGMRWSARMFRATVAACLLLLSIACVAPAAQLNAPYQARGKLGPYYCVLYGYICLDRLQAGTLDDGLCATQHLGNVEGNVLGNQVHLVFHCDFGVSGDSLYILPVDSTIVLSPEVSSSLGYDRIILQPGRYPVDYSRYHFGETYIDAILTGPTPVRNENSRSSATQWMRACPPSRPSFPADRSIQRLSGRRLRSRLCWRISCTGRTDTWVPALTCTK